MSLMIGSKDNVAFATVNVVGSSNEDRACALLSHGLPADDTGFKSFGIFDGHNGAHARIN
ncbi:hypothetical protein B484DRAFT_390787 [Ochromonadaceae sp. CCMP2298]|nr:hypothetical protein B484DRAFT_390787 [Ochromonadaceae sp. CCMP2298]